MTKRLVIISGASRGLGFALAQAFIDANTTLVNIARNNNAELVAMCQQAGATWHSIQVDLAHTSGAELASQQLAALLAQHSDATQLYLINNAGTVAPMAQAHQLQDPKAIAQALQLNVGSLISLTSCFLAHTPAHADRRILNISSGAGRSAVPGWGVYGATKAAVDYFTQTLAVEHPQVRSVALAPGVVDTDMQATIRQTDDTHFPNRERFINLHQNQQLASATYTAEQIARYLTNDDFGQKTIDDIRHYF